MNIIELIGYHATLKKNEASIKRENFNVSIGSDHWVGCGAYFFTDGSTATLPAENARKWAEYKRFNHFVVLKAVIKVEEQFFLDLTTRDGRQIFGYMKEKYIDFFIKTGKVKLKSNREKPKIIDGDIIDKAPKILKRLDAVKNDACIRFSDDLNYGVASRVPNTTILSVIKPKMLIALDCIETLEESTPPIKPK